MLTGEFAVATDTGNAWYCYSSGKVKLIATSEDLAKAESKADMLMERAEAAEKEAINARQAAERVAITINEKLADGSLIGPAGPPGPPGIQGPQGVQGPEGQRGGAGLATSLGPGIFEVSVNDLGHLIVRHNDNDPVPPLSIVNGRLKYTIS